MTFFAELQILEKVNSFSYESPVLLSFLNLQEFSFWCWRFSSKR